MSTTAEITVEVVENDAHDGDTVLAVLAQMFRATGDTPPMPAATAPAGAIGPAMCRARSFLMDPDTPSAAALTPPHLAHSVDVDILGPSDAVQQARRLLADVFTVQDLGWVSGEHEFETRLRLT
ncbi:hypothetical protein [Streptacidiphilus jiangxiensis]|uniref:Uncharacterized protein n=1 Tax=Streptacidiphilus jiangxiensis TaxID=235985 RepID=A0A1H7HXT8_STRJI|nr:hypothetical protein [Streptacidiphilus jiangxiensis]SEK54924.1 hypothetical protein SAMN05414137_102402 [Streptacidiphilus jiangxiensis]